MRCYSNDEVISRVKKHLESKENCQPLVDDVASYNYNYGKGYSYDATFEPLERSWLVIATPREFLSEIFRWRYYEESDSVVIDLDQYGNPGHGHFFHNKMTDC